MCSYEYSLILHINARIPFAGAKKVYFLVIPPFGSMGDTYFTVLLSVCFLLVFGVRVGISQRRKEDNFCMRVGLLSG